MKKLNSLTLIFVIFVLLSNSKVFTQPSAKDAFSIVLPSAGCHSAIMPITKWGRYSISTTGDNPVALSIADKRNGVFCRDGDAGQRNARIDLFLDNNEYRLQIQGDKTASGSSKISAVPFTYPADFKSSYLIQLRENQLSLNDLQQVAFWFEVPSDTTVYIEAVGRNLEDMRLWRDGEWMIETVNSSFTSLPKPETPLKGISMVAKITKGTYMVGVYGGKGQDWAIKSTDHPLYLKWGIETLNANIGTTMIIPPKGFTQVLLTSDVNVIVGEAAEKKRLTFTVNGINENYESLDGIICDSIHPKSTTAQVSLNIGSLSQVPRLCKITGTPGQSFSLQTIGSSSTVLNGKESNAFWVSSIHTGNYLDRIGVSGVVLDRQNEKQIIAIQADTVSTERGLARRFNLLDNMNMFLWVDSDGKYSLTPGGTDISWRIYRYFYSPPPNFAYPDFKQTALNVDLKRGLYRLELQPVKKGIATFTITKSSFLGGLVAAGKTVVGTGDEKTQWNQPCPSVQFTQVNISTDSYYNVVLNDQSPDISVATSRPLPINPDLPLTLWCKKGEMVHVPIKISARRLITISDSRNLLSPFIIDGKMYDKGAELEAGSYTVIVNNSSLEPRHFILKATSPEMLPASPVPQFPDEKRNNLPHFQVIAAGDTGFCDLDRQSSRSYIIEVKEPALYRIETIGRLATHLTLRDRFGNFTRTAETNGVGRNAMLIAYLLAGQYQVSVSTLERSTGHLGIAVNRNPLLDGGIVEKDIDNKTAVPYFAGVRYDIRIPADGTYRIESLGQNGNFPIRFEDSSGWPFDPAENSDPYQLVLEKGSYRLISLPVDQDSRRITRLTEIVASRKLKGKGPHALELNSTISSTWVNNTKDTTGSSKPVVFTFTLSSPISAKLFVSNGFTGSLFKEGQDSALVKISGKRKQNLDMGSYRFLIKPLRKCNYAPFQVSVTTQDLIPGLSYQLTKPQTIGVNVGVASVVELVSQGMLDVSAQLLDDKASSVIASNDDSYIDWNFSISRVLKPGRYYLRVKSAEGDFTSTRVFMRALSDTLIDTLSSAGNEPKIIHCNLNRHIAILPISESDTGDIISMAVQGKSRMGCSIERKFGNEWMPVAQDQGSTLNLSVPREKHAKYRLRTWSGDNSNDNITLSYASVSPKMTTWKDAQNGLSGQTMRIGENHCAWFKIDLGERAPGHYNVRSEQNSLNGIAVSETIDTAFTNESPSLFSSAQQFAWVELRFEHQGRFQVKMEPMILENDKPVTIDLNGIRPQVFETNQSENSVGLLSVETDGFHPLAGVLRSPANGIPSLSVRGLVVDQSMWLDAGRCATVSLPSDKKRLVVWNSLAPNDGSTISAKLSWCELTLNNAGMQKSGISSWHVTKPSAQVTHFAKGISVRIRITLPPLGAAFVTRTDGSRLIECNYSNEAIVKEFVTDGGDLYLLGLRGEMTFDVATFIIGSNEKVTSRTLNTGSGLELKLPRDGTVLIPLDEKLINPDIYFRGAIRSISWISSDGALHPDVYDGMPVGPGGFLKVDHKEGWIKLDLCNGEKPADVMACKWGAALTFSGAAEVNQSSQLKLSNTTNWFTFNIEDTQHVNLSVPLPLSAILLRDGKPVNFQEAWEQFNWDLPLTPGKYQLGIHAINGSNLEGAALAILFRPIAVLSEKNPFNSYIAPGESRLLSFNVQAKSTFGIGLRMNRETVKASLYDSNGKEISNGKQQFVTLDKGKYYLWLRVPVTNEGTGCTVYLFGQEPPPNEPPERVIKWIISGGEGERPKAEALVDDEDNEANRRPSWMRSVSHADSEVSEERDSTESRHNDENSSEPEMDNSTENTPVDSVEEQEGD